MISEVDDQDEYHQKPLKRCLEDTQKIMERTMSDKIKTTKEEREAKKALKLAQEKELVENMCVYDK